MRTAKKAALRIVASNTPLGAATRGISHDVIKPRIKPMHSGGGLDSILKAVMELPPAVQGEYELTEKETKTLRSRLYSLNKHNAIGAKWRTMREAPYTMVWRVR